LISLYVILTLQRLVVILHCRSDGYGGVVVRGNAGKRSYGCEEKEEEDGAREPETVVRAPGMPLNDRHPRIGGILSSWGSTYS